MRRVDREFLVARYDVSLEVPHTAGARDNAQLRTDLHLTYRLDTIPVNGLEVLIVRRQHGRTEEALVAQVLHDPVGDRDSVGTRVDATSETVDMEFGQYHRAHKVASLAGGVSSADTRRRPPADAGGMAARV